MSEGSPKQPQQPQAPAQAPQAPDEQEATEPSPDASSEALAKEESILSPEAMEKIMAKVVDINARGTAFTVVGAMTGGNTAREVRDASLKSVMRNGLLGFSSPYADSSSGERAATQRAITEGNYFTKERWVAETRRTHNTKSGQINTLWFHVIDHWKPRNIKEGGYATCIDSDGIVITVEFDLAHFKKEYWSSTNVDSSGKTPGTRLENNTYADKGHAHVLYPRVAPRFLTGICVGIYKPSLIRREDSIEKHGANWSPEDSEDIIAKVIKNLVNLEIETYKDKAERLLPVYDMDGNLWWPKQMSYEEVKKLVAEREAKKADKK